MFNNSIKYILLIAFSVLLCVFLLNHYIKTRVKSDLQELTVEELQNSVRLNEKTSEKLDSKLKDKAKDHAQREKQVEDFLSENKDIADVPLSDELLRLFNYKNPSSDPVRSPSRITQ